MSYPSLSCHAPFRTALPFYWTIILEPYPASCPQSYPVQPTHQPSPHQTSLHNGSSKPQCQINPYIFWFPFPPSFFLSFLFLSCLEKSKQNEWIHRKFLLQPVTILQSHPHSLPSPPLQMHVFLHLKMSRCLERLSSKAASQCFSVHLFYPHRWIHIIRISPGNFILSEFNHILPCITL